MTDPVFPAWERDPPLRFALRRPAERARLVAEPARRLRFAPGRVRRLPAGDRDHGDGSRPELTPHPVPHGAGRRGLARGDAPGADSSSKGTPSTWPGTRTRRRASRSGCAATTPPPRGRGARASSPSRTFGRHARRSILPPRLSSRLCTTGRSNSADTRTSGAS